MEPSPVYPNHDPRVRQQCIRLLKRFDIFVPGLSQPLDDVNRLGSSLQRT